MLSEIKTIEEYSKIKKELHKEWCKIHDYQMKQSVIHGISWMLCPSCNGEFEDTLKSFRDKEDFLKEIWDKNFSYNAIISRVVD